MEKAQQKLDFFDSLRTAAKKTQRCEIIMCIGIIQNNQTNCNLKRRALHPNACSAGVSSLHSWAPLDSFLHAVIGWEITFTAQKRYRAIPRSPG